MTASRIVRTPKPHAAGEPQESPARGDAPPIARLSLGGARYGGQPGAVAVNAEKPKTGADQDLYPCPRQDSNLRLAA